MSNDSNNDKKVVLGIQIAVDRINQRITDELVPKVGSSGIIHGSDICKIINEELGFEDGFINCYPDIRVDELNPFFIEE